MRRLPFAVALAIPVLATLGFTVACASSQKPQAAPAQTEGAPTAQSADPATSSAPAVAASNEAAASPAPTASAPAPLPAPINIKLQPKSGSKVQGTATFEQTAAGVKVTLDLSHAPPGEHGAHIHQNADCSDKDGKSAGDHFNPTMHEHGLPPTEMRHLGDLGNITVGKDGKGHLEITIPGANLIEGDKMSFRDRGIIIHEKVDNGGQPAGNAGKRIACGEIK